MNRARCLRSASALSLLLAATACDPAAVLGDRGSASRGMEALMGALSLGAGSQFREADTDIPDLPDVPGADGGDFEHELEIDVNVPCPDGGSMQLQGKSRVQTDVGGLDGEDTAWGGAQTEFELTVSFEACDVDGVTIDGDIGYQQDLDVHGTTTSVEIDYQWSYQGYIEFSGAVEGGCEVEMHASYTGDGSDADLDLAGHTYAGSMCGYDASEVADEADL